MLGPHQSPIDFAWINPTNSIILELWKKLIHAYLKKKCENRKLFENRRKFVKMHADEKMTTNILLKLDFWQPKTLRKEGKTRT